MSQEERLMILQMVADKKISANEAAELLKALDQKEAGGDPGGTPGPEDAEAVRQGQASGEEGRTGSGGGAWTSPGGAGGRTSAAGTLVAGLGSFLEDVAERVASAVNSVAGPRFEFPSSFTGQFAPGEIPLRINTGNGRVAVQAWDQPGYQADVLVRARGADEAEAQARARKAFTVTADEGGFQLEASRINMGDVAVHVTLKVPRDRLYRAEIHTGNGEVALAELELADGRVVTGNGKMLLRGGRAERLTLRSGNGNIEVESENGELDAETGNGSVTLRPTDGRSQVLRISTGNGSIRLNTSLLSPDTGVQVDASTGMGSINLALPDLTYDRDNASPANRHVVVRTAQFQQAGAKVMVSARTGMGSITIE